MSPFVTLLFCALYGLLFVAVVGGITVVVGAVVIAIKTPAHLNDVEDGDER